MEIPVLGIGTDDVTPGNYIEVLLPGGGASSGGSSYSACIIANYLSTGSASAATVYGPSTLTPLASQDDANALFGRGSEAARLYARFIARNNSTALSVVTVAESSGAKSDGYVGFSGGASALNATARFYLGDEYVDAGIAKSDSCTAIATAVAAAINGKLDWPVTALASSAGVTITARQKGLRGNQIRYFCRILVNGTGITPSVTSSTAMANGTTADDSTDALAAIRSQRFYYLISAATDSTQVDALLTQVATMAEPADGKTQRVFVGNTDSAATAITFATGRNNVRCEVVWLPSWDMAGGEMGACAAAVYAKLETLFGGDARALNMNGVDLGLKAPLLGTAATKPTRAQIKSALNNGVTPLQVNDNGSTSVVKRITSKSATSSQQDFRVRPAHIVTVCDRFADDLRSKFASQFGGKLVGDDPVDGEVTPQDVVTPRVVKAAINRLIDVYAGNSLVDQVAEIKLGVQVVHSEAVPSRLSARIPLRVIDILDQTTAVVSQISRFE